MSKKKSDSKKRAAWNFKYYMQRIIRRLGFRDAEISVNVRHGRLNSVQVTVQGGQDRAAASAAPSARSFDAMREALQLRLERLLRHCSLLFGKVVIRVRDGNIVDVRFGYLVRTDEMGDMAYLLFNPRK